MKKIIGIFLLVVLNVFSSGLAGAEKAKVINYSKSDIQKYITNDVVSVSYYDLTSKEYQKDKVVYKSYYEQILEIMIKFLGKEADEEFVDLAKSFMSIDSYMYEVLFLLEKNSLAESLNQDIYSDISTQKQDGTSLIFKGNNKKIEEILNKYFDYNGQIYIPQDSDTEIYIKKDGEYFILAFDMESLDNYLSGVMNGNQNTEFINKFSSLKKENYIFSLIDLNKLLDEFDAAKMYSSLFVEKLGYSYGIPKLKEKQIEYVNVVEGSGTLFDLLDSSKLENRDLSSYKPSEGVSLYFANNSFRELVEKINNIYMSFSGQDMITMAQANYPPNVSFLDFLDNIGSEAIFALDKKGNSEKFSLALNSKNMDEVKNVLMHFGAIPEGDKLVFNSDEIYVKNNKVFLNEEFEKSNDIKDTENLFLALNANLGFLDEKYSQYDYSLYLYNREDGIESRITYDLDEVMELLNDLSNDFGGI